MFKKTKKIKAQELVLYNNILALSRNKLLYTIFNLTDTFQNRIHLIFIHVSFLFIKIKHSRYKDVYKIFYQKLFDLIFNNIELNMRELGYGDVVINKNMKFLIKTFYNILLNCENLSGKSLNAKKIFFLKYLKLNNIKKEQNTSKLIEYFDKYQTFCLDLTPDSVLKGDFKFKYK